MNEGENEDQAMNDQKRLEELYRMVQRIEQTSTDNSKKLDKLYQVVIGNGDDGSIIIRLHSVDNQLRSAEKEREQMSTELVELHDCVDRLEKTTEAWKNRAAAIAIVLSAAGGFFALFGSRVITAIIGP